MQKGFIGPTIVVLIGILALAGLIGLAFYLGKKSTGPTATTPVAQQDETTNWKTYTSQVTQVELKLPQDWTERQEGKTLFLKDKKSTSEITIVKDFEGGFGSNLEEARDPREITIGGQKATIYYYHSADNFAVLLGESGTPVVDRENIFSNIFIERGQGNYLILGMWKATDQDAEILLNQILSTFKFTN
ncbi:MAG: hypothetical protein Q7S45_02850 [Candidatus Curtissbacteria bacterium]|nr:hypothetical protein [Candidatus Curtissbacteria bacterium]